MKIQVMDKFVRALIGMAVGLFVWAVILVALLELGRSYVRRSDLTVVAPIQDPAVLSGLLFRWQAEGGQEIAEDEFRVLSPAADALLLVAPDRTGANLVYVAQFGPEAPLAYYTERRDLTGRQLINYRHYRWWVDGMNLVIRSDEPNIPAKVGVVLLDSIFAIWLGVVIYHTLGTGETEEKEREEE
jgi:hypothetical protein